MKKIRIVVAAALSAGAALAMTACGTGGAGTDGAAGRPTPAVSAAGDHAAHEGGKSAHGSKDGITTKDADAATEAVLDVARKARGEAPQRSTDGWWFNSDINYVGTTGMSPADVPVPSILNPDDPFSVVENDAASSLSNQSDTPLCVYSDTDFQGTSHYVAPRTSINDLSSIGMNDTISSWRQSPDPANKSC